MRLHLLCCIELAKLCRALVKLSCIDRVSDMLFDAFVALALGVVLGPGLGQSGEGRSEGTTFGRIAAVIAAAARFATFASCSSNDGRRRCSDGLLFRLVALLRLFQKLVEFTRDGVGAVGFSGALRRGSWRLAGRGAFPPES